MALTFGAATSDRVTMGAGLNNQHAFTVLAWVYNTTHTDGRRLWMKGGDQIKDLYLSFGAPTGDFSLYVTRAGADADAHSTSGVIPLNEWALVAASYDETDGPRLFKGSLTSTIAEVSSYVTLAVGDGATADDSASPHTIGNRSSTTNQAFQGRIARFAHFKRRLALQEIAAWQFVPFVDADTDIYLELGYTGTGTQPNLTSAGGGINGTVTGATVSDHVPLSPPFQFASQGFRVVPVRIPVRSQHLDYDYSR